MNTKTRIILMTSLTVGSSALATLNIETVLVGDAGNIANRGFGAVSYEYHIGKYEVTNNQYAAFLNAAAKSDPNRLYSLRMDFDPKGGLSGGIVRSGSDGDYVYTVKPNMGDKPVNYVSFYDAARFTNWLSTGDTENGVYLLNPTGISNNTIARDMAAWASGGVAIASEDEWYKAAYYDGNGGYFIYPTQSNIGPGDTGPTIATANVIGDISNPGTNVANYNNGADWNGRNGNVTTVGSAGAGSESYYGTSDQGGNVFEWNESVILGFQRGVRGGAFNSINTDPLIPGIDMTIFSRGSSNPQFEEGLDTVGFRVTSLAAIIPEPSAIVGLPIILGLATLRRHRR